MHFEILVEELSAEKVLRNILPEMITGEHTFRIITHQGKMDMLTKIPKSLAGYAKWIPSDYVIVLLIDRDKQDCLELKKRLEQFSKAANLTTKSASNSDEPFVILNRIAIEELESWLLGDADAVRAAYPRVSKNFERKSIYRDPDSISGASEALERLLQRSGYFGTGLRKVECAEAISRHMQPLRNRSKSFNVFWEGISCCLNSGKCNPPV